MYVYVCNLERGWVGMCIMMQVSRVRGDRCFTSLHGYACGGQRRRSHILFLPATLLIFRIISLREPSARWFCQAGSQKLLPISGFFCLNPSLCPPALSLYHSTPVLYVQNWLLTWVLGIQPKFLITLNLRSNLLSTSFLNSNQLRTCKH